MFYLALLKKMQQEDKLFLYKTKLMTNVLLNFHQFDYIKCNIIEISYIYEVSEIKYH